MKNLPLLSHRAIWYSWCCLWLAASALPLNAQILNSNSYHLQVNTERLCVNDTDDGRFNFSIQPTGEANKFIGCIKTGGGCALANVELLKKIATNNTGFTIGFEGWEEDGCGGDCSYDTGCINNDDDRVTGFDAIGNAQNFGSPCEWVSRDLGISGNKYHFAWRYTHGDGKSDPLDFGVISPGTGKSHVNSNRSNPSGSDAKLGYSNSWSGGAFKDTEDVYYTFEVEQSSQVSITTWENESNFNTYIHLLDGATQSVLISEDDSYWANGNFASSLATINTRLCPGKYGIVVEGGTGLPRGDFRLSVSVVSVPVNPGSIAIDGTSRLCQGRTLTRVKSNSDASSSISGQTPAYSWERNTVDPNNENAWTPVAGSAVSLESPGTMGSTDIWFRRKAADCGSTAYSNVVKFTNQAFNGVGGQIVLSNTHPIPGGSDGGSINSTQPGSAGHDYTIIWEARPEGSTQWVSIDDAHGQTLQIGPLNVTTEFRRVVESDCVNERVVSNIVEKIVIPVDGVIEGRVASRLNTPVAGVKITATLQGTLPGSSKTVYEATTDPEGKYRISAVYYGAGEATFKVVPSRDDHEFINVNNASSDFATVTLSSGNKTQSGINFTDITSLTIKGNIYQELPPAIADCQLAVEGVTVELVLNGSVVNEATTDARGDYELSVDNGVGTYGIRPSFAEHTFEPIERILLVEDNLDQINFEDTQRQILSGKVEAGCNTPMGVARLNLATILPNLSDEEPGDEEEAAPCTVSFTIDTDAEGNYGIEIPARAYLFSFQDIVGNPNPGFDKAEIRSFLNLTHNIDLTTSDHEQDFIFHRPPVIEVTGMPATPGCGFSHPILDQGKSYPLMIKAYEGEIGGCPVDTGFLEINDQMGDVGSITREFKLENPETEHISYELVAGFPSLSEADDYLKNLTITLKAVYGEKILTSGTFSDRALVTGAKPQGQGNLTVSPDLPLFILRDPPGDQSYSFLSESTGYETATRFYSQEGGANNAWANVRVGTEFETGLGFTTETEIWADIGTSFSLTEQTVNTEESIVTMTTNRSFSTADDADIIGEKGDLIIGAAMNMVYASTVEVLFNEQTCRPYTKNDWMIDNQGVKTNFIYTTSHIREVVIRDLREAMERSADPAEKNDKRNQISIWEQVLAYNEQLKKEAELIRNETFAGSAGGAEPQTETIASTESLTIEYQQEIDEEVALEAGLNIAGSGLSGGAVVNMRMGFGEASGETEISELTTGYVLDDDDPNDQLSVDIKKDPVYKTPVFDLVSGQTSCPYEPPTRARDAVEISATDPIVTGVDPADAAEFFVNVTNNSETSETRSFILKAPSFSTNPFGAEITIGGQDPPYLIEDLGAGQTASILVKIEQGASTIYSYSGMTFEVEAECDPGISASVDLSAYFESSCSKINLVSPEPGWILNQANENKLPIFMDGFEPDKLDQIVLEYARAGTSGWTPVMVLNSDDPLLSNPGFGATVEMDWSAIPDGVYDIRLKLACSSGTETSEKVRGRVERSAPQVFGLPRPIDDIFDLGDEIAVRFNEEINCAVLGADDLNISAEIGRLEIPLTFICSETEIRIQPEDDGIGILENPGLPFVVTINGIEDIYGNAATAPIQWTFTAAGEPETFDADNDGVNDDVDICPGFNDNVDTDGDGIPDGCDLCPELANAGLSFDGNNDYVNLPATAYNPTVGTIECWFKTPDPNTWQVPFYISDQTDENGFTAAGNALEFHAAVANGRALVIFQSGPAGQAIRLRTLSSLEENRWYHLAVTYDLNGEIRLYLNGVLEDDDDMTFYLLEDRTPSLFRLGRPGAGINQFQGSLDEVRVWNVARSEMEIHSSYETEAAAAAEGLLAYYDFNQGKPDGDNTGLTTLHDQSGNGYHGSLLNFASSGQVSNWVFGGPAAHLDSDGNGIGDACELPVLEALLAPSAETEPTKALLAPAVNQFRVTRLFPVPAQDRLFLNYLLSKDDRVNIELFDLRGQAVIRQLSEGLRGINKVTLDVADLPAGYYLLRLSRADGTFTVQKVVVQ